VESKYPQEYPKSMTLIELISETERIARRSLKYYLMLFIHNLGSKSKRERPRAIGEREIRVRI